jgi:general secretion pathway protein M
MKGAFLKFYRFIVEGFRRLSVRERRLIFVFLGLFLGFILFFIIFHVSFVLSDLEESIQDVGRLIEEMEKNRESYLRKREVSGGIERMLERRAPPLRGYLEGLAHSAGLTIPESVEKPDVPKGRRYVEKSVKIKFRKVALEQLTNFMKRIKNAPFALAITEIYIRKRFNEPNSMDVEMTVSVYEKAKKKRRIRKVVH